MERAAKRQCKKDERGPGLWSSPPSASATMMSNGGAARQGQGLERARVRPDERRISDTQGDAREGVPELGARACQAQGRDAAVAGVPA